MTPTPPNTPRRSVLRRVLAFSTLGVGFWWILSILLHSALVGILYVEAPPPPTAASASSDFDMTISPDRVRDVVKEIRQQESERFKQKVQDILQAKRELDRLNAEKIAQYNQIMKQEAKNAVQDLPTATTQVLVAQKQALAAQQSARNALTDFKAAHEKAATAANPQDAKTAEAAATTALQKAQTAQAQAASAQLQASIAQQEIAEQLKLAVNSPEAQTAHQAAIDAQTDASKTQATTATTLKQIAKAKQALAAAQEEAAHKKAISDQANEKAATAAAELAPEQQAAVAARQKFDAAHAAATASNTAVRAAAKADKKSLTALAREANAAERQARQEMVKAAQNERPKQIIAKHAKVVAAQQQQRTDRANDAVQKRQEALNDTIANAAADSATQQQAAASAQQSSIALQETANAAIAKALVAQAHTDGAAPATTAQATVIPTPNPDDAQNLADLYQQAQAAEIATAETYKNVRAAELAAIQKIPLADALAMTKVATPDRAALDTAILKQDISAVKDVRKQEKTINAASGQMDAMVALAQRMSDLASASGTNLSVAQIEAQSAHNEQMERLAMEDSGAKAKDLSGAMTAADGGPGSGGPGHNGDQPVSPNTVPGITEIPAKDYKPLYGRTVRADMIQIEAGRNPAWVYVNSWYLIGPWPNPGRKNLNTKFPPETVVDLDAVYAGGHKDEVPMPISWKFFQMPSSVTGKDHTPVIHEITPPGLRDFEIYYGYTELWFDEPEDLWVAIGSDDQSKVWLNDQLIWKSADYYKSWVPNEGLRKVHFRKGINRVLYRLENGQNSGGFSFLICLSKDPS